jgi:hypothetical protein
MNHDPWVRANSELPPEVLHALGVISFRWNSCEFGLKMLFAESTGISVPNSLLITQEMGSITISAIIRETFELRKRDAPIVDEVLFSLDLFDVNRLNRNQLTHYLPATGPVGMEIRRNKVFGGVGGESIPSKVTDVRRVADEIGTLRTHLARIYNHLKNPNVARYPLPQRPPLPERLWKPLPPNQPKPPRQPVS